MEHVSPAISTGRRPAQRWLWCLLWLAALLAAAWGGYRLTHPRLRLVTHRVLTDMQPLCSLQIGYPAYFGRVVHDTFPFHPFFFDTANTGYFINAHGQQVGSDTIRNGDVRISPTRKLVALVNTKSIREYHLPEKAGAPLPAGRRRKGDFVSLTDAGAVVWARPNTLLTPRNTPFTFTDLHRYSSFTDTDPGYFAGTDMTFGTVTGGFYGCISQACVLYRFTPRMVCKLPVNPTEVAPGMIFHHGGRGVLVPQEGEAVVFAGAKILGSVGMADTVWRWGEDGTVWTITGSAVNLLRWRAGTPGLQPRAIPGRHDATVGSVLIREKPLPNGTYDGPLLIYNTTEDPCWAAAWGDGRLLASTETTRAVPPRLERVVAGLRHLVGSTHTTNAQKRRLALYRNGYRIGTATVPLTAVTTQSSWTGASYFEHLAFTADGRHLCWMIRPGDGKTHVYVFDVHP